MAGKIVIAVDFGTTYSAIGYAKYSLKTKPTEAVLHIIDDDWPGQGSERSPKVPTVFKIVDEKFQYGFEVEYDDDRVAFSKLFLDPFQLDQATELRRCVNIQEVRNQQLLLGGVTKFLKALRLRALDHMENHPTSRWSKDFIDNAQKEYILTVPAMWSDRARDLTLECAYNAGFGRKFSPDSIKLVVEPEAAASYVINTQPSSAFQIGDAFVVCDAGGGTVIAKPMPDLELHEITVSTGELCGSVYLDQGFLAYVERKLDTRLSLESRQSVLSQFKTEIKPDFSGDDDIAVEYSIYVDSELPNNAAVGFEGGNLVVSSNDLKPIYDNVVDQVLVLLTEQVANVKTKIQNVIKPTILLVGGFGSSSYLKQQVDGMFLPDANVIQPPESWSAVIRGALMRGMIQKRKIRCAYGICIQRVWKPDLDLKGTEFEEQHRVWDPFRQEWYCTGCMQWYVKKGEEFAESKTVIFPFFRVVGLNHKLIFRDILYAHRDPDTIDGNTGPDFLEPDCEPYKELVTDLPEKIPDIRQLLERANMKKRNQLGNDYYEVHFDIGMEFDNEIKFYLIFEGHRFQIEAKLLNTQVALPK